MSSDSWYFPYIQSGGVFDSAICPSNNLANGITIAKKAASDIGVMLYLYDAGLEYHITDTHPKQGVTARIYPAGRVEYNVKQ
jgi:hypothetical protein